MNRHLLSIDDVTAEDIAEIFATAAEMHDVQRREVKKLPALRGRTVINLFFEDSTRTRVSFEIARRHRFAADMASLPDDVVVHVLPTGNAGNISAYWLGYREAHEAGEATRRPRMRGWQAAGSAPLVRGEPVGDPETVASAIRIGNPARGGQALEAMRESGGGVAAVTDSQILAAYRRLAAEEGVFCEPADRQSGV